MSVTVHRIEEEEEGPDNMVAVKLAIEIELFVDDILCTVIPDTLPPDVLHTKL